MLGHSWGANIALFYSLKFPQFCKGIIYLCGLGVQNDTDWHSECAQNAAELKGPERPIPEGYSMNYDVLNGALDSYAKYIQSSMLYKNISMLQVPVCIICGEKDIRPVWPVFQLSNLLPMATLKIICECGHFPWLSHPDLLRKTIFDWFDNTTV
jgi:proline iminopeptidase